MPRRGRPPKATVEQVAENGFAVVVKGRLFMFRREVKYIYVGPEAPLDDIQQAKAVLMEEYHQT